MTVSWLGRELQTNMQSDSVIHSSLVEQRLNQRQEDLALSLINSSDSLSVFLHYTENPISTFEAGTMSISLLSVPVVVC